MADTQEIKVPDIGGATDVDVIEILVSPGDEVKPEDSLITLEGDKATMEVPAPQGGVVDDIKVKVGDKVSEGSLILTLKTKDKSESTTKKEKKSNTKTTSDNKQQTANKDQAIKVPDIGGATEVDVIEILVKEGDNIKTEDSMITLEGDKATMEVPAPLSGTVKEIKLKVGDKVSEGDLILTLSAREGAAVKETAKPKEPSATKPPSTNEQESAAMTEKTLPDIGDDIHAGPAVRRIAREFAVNLQKIKATGPKNRITKEDIQKYVRQQLKIAEGGGTGFAFAPAPTIDFNKFGETELKPLSKINKLSAANLHRNWVTIPHVTQHEEVDITLLETFRQQQKVEAAKEGIKLTPLVFIMKAVVAALKEFPKFNASLDDSGQNLIIKKYFHIGVAVDTPNGLVVPVIRDVDRKGLYELAKELGDISKKAREKRLGMADMQGGCFSISSLGGIGGTSFTPIINAPEVAILGVSRSSYKPVYRDGEFEPRLLLPLSLSYDHRVIDGADAARFIVYLASRLKDIRTLLL